MNVVLPQPFSPRRPRISAPLNEPGSTLSVNDDPLFSFVSVFLSRGYAIVPRVASLAPPSPSTWSAASAPDTTKVSASARKRMFSAGM